MTKKIWLLGTLALLGCGGGEELSTDGTPLTQHQFQFENRTWNITTPSDWTILPAEAQVLFIAQKGSENVAILERDLTSEDPVSQIINSAQNQFFAFTLDNQEGARWQFTGQPGPTNTPRTFHQEIKTVDGSRKFLLASCSQIAGSPNGTQCPAILNSWSMVPVGE